MLWPPCNQSKIQEHLSWNNNDDDNNKAKDNDDATTSILILCNGGLAVRQELQDYVQQTQSSSFHNKVSMHVGSLTHGVYRQPGNREDKTLGIVHAGVGRIYVPDTVSVQHLGWPGLESVSHNAMEAILWKKLAANSVCNPLTGLYQCTNERMPQVVPHFKMSSTTWFVKWSKCSMLWGHPLPLI